MMLEDITVISHEDSTTIVPIGLQIKGARLRFSSSGVLNFGIKTARFDFSDIG